MSADVERFLRDYLKELESGDAAIFAGAGLSAPAGFVDWRGLLRDLAKDLSLNVDLESDLVSLAQFHVNSTGNNRNRLNQAIIESLSADNPPTENHKILSRLPIGTYWTTNYDNLIETSLRSSGMIVDVKFDVMQLANTKPRRDAIVYKMHGDISHPNDAVVTRDDYEGYSRERGAFTNALSGDLVSKTFLFLGFSFSDPNLSHVLAQVRMNFRENQRQHFAIFKRRARMESDTDEVYAHEKARQLCVVEDLKRFNIQVILVDDYSDITEILKTIDRRYRRRSVFVSASASDFAPWGEAEVSEFMRTLGASLIKKKLKLVTGLGSGVGISLFTGAVEEVLSVGGRHIEDEVFVRPFPQVADSSRRDAVWADFRSELVSRAGIALFLFGNKAGPSGPIDADGMADEFEKAYNQGLVLLPIGATGSISSVLAQVALKSPDAYLPALDEGERASLQRLAEPATRLAELIEPVTELVARLRGKA